MAEATKTNDTALIVPPSPPMTNAAMMEDIRPLKAPVTIPGSGWLLWTVVVLLLVSGGIAAWWLLRRKQSQIPSVPPPPPPADRARQRLKEALGLINQPKPYCFEVSAALREYLEERFRLHAPDRTTEEFLAELQATSTLDPQQKSSLRDFLIKCDLVKFAKFRPGMTELMSLQSAALELINQTAAPAQLTSASAPATTPPALARR